MGNFNMLPKEIMLEIFSRAPAESVIECKSVSKSWRNLLQRPSFPQMHLNHLNDPDAAHDSGNLSLIFYTKWLLGKEPFYYTEYDENLNRFTRTTRINVTPPFEYYDILNSCNGLVCFSAYLGNCHNMQPAYICNPITREYTVIPKFEGKDFLAGFGYSPSTNEYKVVRISRDKGDPNYGIVQLYTLGSSLDGEMVERWTTISYVLFNLVCLQMELFIGWATKIPLLPSIWSMKSLENFHCHLGGQMLCLEYML
ncbi:F-box protein At3g07870-like [Papaver somniferum]|uniref:F-box protein At3g07870-like n=1 Tax=Papaver somniferum TaxID=3469 RepID=UPI000E6F9B25|nr:F-box protein At3g07870-like [Papaver somniferum]